MSLTTPRLVSPRLMSVWAALVVATAALATFTMPPGHAQPNQPDEIDSNARFEGARRTEDGLPSPSPLMLTAWEGHPPSSAMGRAEPLAGNPPELPNDGSYTLRVQRKRLRFAGAAELGGPREVELLTYNAGLVGPTIRVRRGDTLRIKLINELSKDDVPRYSVDFGQEDPPHELYTTNLHTHGLHVSPTGNSDNPLLEVPPGTTQDYVLSIPADHPAGTFWYHPHKHGAVAYQMGNGLAGALIVEGRPDDALSDLDDVPEIAAAKERILMLQQLVLEVDEQGIGRVDPRDSYSEPAAEAYRVTAVNGEVMPTYTIRPEEVQRWRLIGASREGSAMICWYDHRHQRVNQMPLYEIAVDGLPLGKVTARRSVTMLPGKRSDVLVKAPAQPGTYYLAALVEDESPGANERLIVNELARLVVEGPPKSMKLPTSEQVASCKPFESIAASECTAKRDLVLSFDDRKKRFHINGESYSQQKRPDQTILNATEEWALTATDAPEGSPNEPHPFHLHTNPFEVVDVEDLRRGVVYPLGEWRDTFAVEPGKRVRIRLHFRDFAGPIVMHCHTLDHGDQGMMRTIQVIDSSQPEVASEPAAELVDCYSPAPAVCLSDVWGRPWDLHAFEGRPVILVFFRGMQCVHCVRQLRSLLDAARDQTGDDIVIAAVSAAPIIDPTTALNWLPIPAGVEFYLLADESHEAFRSFGCYTDSPQHGLFVIDKASTIVARYSGAVPLDNVQDVWDRVDRLRNREATP